MRAPSDRPPPQAAGTQGASLARDVLERAFAELAMLPAGAARDPLLAGYDQARLGLARLAGAAIQDAHYLDHFDAACATLRSLARHTDGLDDPSARRFARRVEGAATALAQRREQVLDEMVAAQGAVGPTEQPGIAESEARPFRVSAELPALRDVAPSTLRHLLPVHHSSEPAQGPAGARPHGQLHDLARNCLGEMGRMSRLCYLEADQPWSTVVRDFEQRLLANLDAVMGLGRADLALATPRCDPVVAAPADAAQPGEGTSGGQDTDSSPELRSAVAEPGHETSGGQDSWPPPPDSVPTVDPPGADRAMVTTAVPPLELVTTIDPLAVLADYAGEAPGDPDRAFVRSIVLGSLAGEAPVRAALVSLRRVARSTLAAHRRALSLAPHPAIVSEMEKLCHDDEAQLVALAVDVLRARRQPTIARVGTLIGHPHVKVRCSAAAALAQCSERGAAVDLLASQLDAEVDDRALAALAEALLRLDDPRGLAAVRARLTEERELPGAMARAARRQCLTLLSLVGDPSDLPMLLALADHPEELSLLGWHGDPAVITPLLEVLAEPAQPTTHSRAESRPLAAARALERITGATEHDRAPRGPSYRTDAVDPSPPRWRDWWKEHHAELTAGIKHRYGRPFTVAASFDELRREGVPQDVRRRTHLELALLSGCRPAPWLDDWSARFDVGLRDWADHFQRLDGLSSGRLHAPGEWPTRRLGQRHRSVERAGPER